MKLLLTLILSGLAVTSALAQQALVNPSSVTLSKQGTVTVVVTDNKGSSSGGSYATVGTLTATYTNAVSGYASNQGYNYITASSATTGTLNAGTYPVTTYNTPQQVTVILWNESASSGFSISQIELAYNSASANEQAAFETFIETLMQQQISGLQSEMALLQQSDTQQSTDITALQQQLANLQSSYESLTSEQASIRARLTALESQPTGTAVTNADNGTSGESSDNALTYAGVGLGAAGVVGALMNALFNSNVNPSPENQ